MLHVLTVDHGLHAHSAEVAEEVCRQAEALGLSCSILRWSGEKPATGIEAAARQARYALLARWCLTHEAALVVAHTLEDQAETFLMRLARGSGIDGLGAMARESRVPDAQPFVALLRPLLEMPRARLRATLAARGVGWHDDPANADERFERVRIRQLLPLLAEHGITPRAIATSSRRLRRARDAVQRQTEHFLRGQVKLHSLGWAELPRGAFDALPAEARLRVLAELIGHVGGNGAPLHGMAGLERLLGWLQQADAARMPRVQALGGALIVRRKRIIIIGREPGRPGPALRLGPDAPHGVWDKRFDITLRGLCSVVEVIMLGEVAAAGKADTMPANMPKRPKHVPAFVWRAQPAIVREGQLLALPSSGWRAADAPFTDVRIAPIPRLAMPQDEDDVQTL